MSVFKTKKEKAACPNSDNGKHKWRFLRNKTIVTTNGRGASASIRGLYHCSCGEAKLGPMDHNAPGNDLRGTL